MTVRELLIKILTRADTKGLEATARNIGSVQSKTASTQASLKQADAAGNTFAKNMLGGMRSMLPQLGAVATAVGAIRFALRQATQALEEFKEQELSEADLDSALAQAGMLVSTYRDRLLELAGTYQDLTAVGDETWNKALGQLSRFGMTADNVDEVTEAVKNLAGLLDGNFNSAVMLIQRALEGNYEMFTRYGITVEKTGDQAKDLQILFELLAEKGGGLLEARARTLDGMFKQLNNAMTDTRQAMARVAANTGVTQQGLRLLTDAINGVGAAFETTIDFTDGLNTKLPDLDWNAQQVSDSLSDIGKADLSDTMQSVEDLADNIDAAAKAAGEARKQVDAMARAQLDLQLARIEEQVAEGPLTPEQGALAAAKARAAYTEESFDRELAALREQALRAAEVRAKAEEQHAAKASEAQQAHDQYVNAMNELLGSGLATEQEKQAILTGDENARADAFAAIRKRATATRDAAEQESLDRMNRGITRTIAAGPAGLGFGIATYRRRRKDQEQIEEITDENEKLLTNLEDLVIAFVAAKSEMEKSAKELRQVREKAKSSAQQAEQAERLTRVKRQAARTSTSAEITTIESKISEEQQKREQEEKKAQLKAERERLQEQLKAEKEKTFPDLAARLKKEKTEAEAAQAAQQRFEQTGHYGDSTVAISRHGARGRDLARRLQQDAQREIQELNQIAVELENAQMARQTAINDIKQRLAALEAREKAGRS